MRSAATICLIATVALGNSPCNKDRLNALPAMPIAQGASAHPTVDQILMNYVQALGGTEAFRNLKTRVLKGTIQVVGSSELGSVETYEKAPGKGVSTTYIPGDSPSISGFNGVTGWTVDPVEGPLDVTGPDLADLERRFDFYREIRLKEIYPQMNFQGAGTINEREAYVTEAAMTNGAREKFFFDKETALLIRQDSLSPDGSLSRVVLEDYRELDGIKLPYRVRTADSESEVVIQYSEIHHNVPLEDAKFEKPSGR
jgi:hypothetical protein